jgi:hypothetical protein
MATIVLIIWEITTSSTCFESLSWLFVNASRAEIPLQLLSV